ncbi:hypothetical protein AQ611_23325 [Burkholderia singularis]|nr:hypothetical protein AQ611_23325 [Burkholderia sp. Bp7605]
MPPAFARMRKARLGDIGEIPKKLTIGKGGLHRTREIGRGFASAAACRMYPDTAVHISCVARRSR